ncbi:hypothetical protein EDC56_3434 [Sinobacterium caligoides]|uniref:Uncharacterized protein n=1 Tax=Sinobacterium caligoides TaxID=933926 RepID=A0A3N2DGA8_9GAMM|nr:hypothetical protein [Sinobacterium caligoides]ROR98698.1 hypothetical protein EDC56_3434 [Sinobacterium caligoides]
MSKHFIDQEILANVLAKIPPQAVQQQRITLINELISQGVTESKAVKYAYQQHLAEIESEQQIQH